MRLLKFCRSQMWCALVLIGSPAISYAQDPLDPDVVVPPVQYDSELGAFKAFDPDEEPNDWAKANRRVLELGGWRAYLRRANPSPTTSASGSKGIGDLNKADALPVVPANTVSINARSKTEPPRLPSKPVASMVKKSDVRKRIKRKDCPRVVTGTRILLPGKEVGISTQARADLNKLAHCFSARRYIIGSHTDGKGPTQANQELSDTRAKAVLDYLISIGVDESRIQAIGYGELQPIDTNRTERGRKSNSRLDFRIAR